MITPVDTDTICAIATSPGRSGVGIVRVSGPLCRQIVKAVTGFSPTPRHAHYCDFHNSHDAVLDQGIVLFFPSPHSFTGEDVVEFQGHGGFYVLNSLLQEILKLGGRMARPGEFSERAFINDKMDLTQAEAIADLIDSSSEQAARSALRTLQGEFSRLINTLADSITDLRVYVEASIDFSEEDIDFLSEGNIAGKLAEVIRQLDGVLEQARQGAILKEGMSVVIAGKPNAGKSSLLNALAGKESAIVTAIAGTTRDILSEQINIDGMPLHITDTAGLRSSDDVVEQEGIRRALEAIKNADRILLVIDSSTDKVGEDDLPAYLQSIGFAQLTEALDPPRLTIVQNKIDLISGTNVQFADNPIADIHQNAVIPVINLSARQQIGIDLLRKHLKDIMGYHSSGEGGFIARSRHLEALRLARENLLQAQHQLVHSRAGELVAEDLRHAHQHLGEITGEFTTDDLLGRIFASFCVGK
jgi:tRNA modification GTPase